MKQTIIAIIGPSGVGKTTASLELQKRYGIPVIVSCTTRPMRPQEQDGVDHWFMTSPPSPETKCLARTLYGGYDYWAIMPENEEICSYVIDEKGLLDLEENWGDKVNLISFYITRSDRGEIDKQRMDRDLNRETLPDSHYSYLISNEGTISDLVETIKQKIDECISGCN